MSRYPQYDRSFNGYRLFIGNIGERVGKYDLETEFDRFGPLIDIWVARNPPGFAYVVYKQKADAEEAVRSLHGRRVCGKRIRVEFARPYPGPAPKISYVPRQRNRRSRSRSPRRRLRSRSRERLPRSYLPNNRPNNRQRRRSTGSSERLHRSRSRDRRRSKEDSK
ncbi:RNA-binding protein 1-like [Apostichopus japonicus]|uniref:RNA-binding protein 1-like n=1 Tax=Stichopus japonicus TaxID=307972 RepID=UPI003AB4263D